MPTPARAVEVKYRSLNSWPAADRPADRGLSKKWNVGINVVLAEIREELQEMGVTECMVETDHAPESFSRLDGAPRSDVEPRSLKVALWFEIDGQMRVIRCDGHGHWLKNLKAIALTLNRNRLLRAYGTATVSEQYGGFAALPPPGGTSAPNLNPAGAASSPAFDQECANLLLRGAGKEGNSAMTKQILRDPNARRTVFREASKRLHPDKHPHQPEAAKNFQAITDAKSHLDRTDHLRVNS